MKTFIFSYLISVLPLAYVVYPTLSASPVEAVARICFYYGFPMAMVISMVIVALGHLFGMGGMRDAAYDSIHRAAESSSASSGLKVS